MHPPGFQANPIQTEACTHYVIHLISKPYEDSSLVCICVDPSSIIVFCCGWAFFLVAWLFFPRARSYYTVNRRWSLIFLPKCHICFVGAVAPTLSACRSTTSTAWQAERDWLTQRSRPQGLGTCSAASSSIWRSSRYVLSYMCSTFFCRL